MENIWEKTSKEELKKYKIALTIPTGRPNVKKVVKAFLENAKIHGFNLKKFSVYLSIDREYQKTSKEDFFLNEEIKDQIAKVEYIFEEDREKIGQEIFHKFNIDKKIIDSLFVGRGYSKQRNSALLLAVKDKNNFAICLDDDESPFTPVMMNDGSIIWKNLDFFSPHIEALSSGTDITRGSYLGYTSPIPSDFEKNIPEEIRKKLGEALQWGSEIVTSHSFLNLMSKIRYLDEKELTNHSRPFIVNEGKNGKNILTGNMGINLNSFKNGKIPLFYTPPSARGEDTIFALQLSNLEVKEVNSFIFHDPFGLYPEIFNKEFPEFLRNIPVNPQTKERFTQALIGWLKYAPILICMTSKDDLERNHRINEMLAKIGFPTQRLAEILNCPEMNSCENVLRNYYKEVKNHLLELASVQKLWKGEFVRELNFLELNKPIYN